MPVFVAGTQRVFIHAAPDSLTSCCQEPADDEKKQPHVAGITVSKDEHQPNTLTQRDEHKQNTVHQGEGTENGNTGNSCA